MENLQKSLFSLVKYNKGLFKSEKQANFFKSQAINNELFFQSHYSFGVSSYSQRSVKWFFTISEQGIEKVIKQTSKGASVYWANEESFIAANEEANKAKNRAAKLSHIYHKAIALSGKFTTKKKEALEVFAFLDSNDLECLEYQQVKKYRKLAKHYELKCNKIAEYISHAV